MAAAPKIHRLYGTGGRKIICTSCNKWRIMSKNLTPGQLVLILDDNSLPPLQWKRGVVTNVYSGQDSIVRVADVRTANGILHLSLIHN